MVEAQPRLVSWEQRRQDDCAEQVSALCALRAGMLEEAEKKTPADMTDVCFCSGNFHGSCSDCKPDQDTLRVAPGDLPPGISIPGLYPKSDLLTCSCVRKDGSVNIGATIALSKWPMLDVARMAFVVTPESLTFQSLQIRSWAMRTASSCAATGIPRAGGWALRSRGRNWQLGGCGDLN
jgi:hypothetical protein